MRGETDKAKLQRFMSALGDRVSGDGAIYVTGGATAVLRGWRPATIDIDLKADPEPAGFFEALATLKNELDVNIELASPDHFIPPLPGWKERSQFIGQYGSVRFFHYDFYGQALSKLQRRHDRDVRDVRSMLRDRLVDCDELKAMFTRIEPMLIRYPAIDADAFRRAVIAFCDENAPENTAP